MTWIGQEGASFLGNFASPWACCLRILDCIVSKYSKDVGGEFDEFWVDTHICKLGTKSIARFLSDSQTKTYYTRCPGTTLPYRA